MHAEPLPVAFRHPLRVYWEDTDAGGVVFYANYLKFFERARTEWLRALGVGQQRLREDQGLMFVVADTALRYLRAARLDDQLDVTVAVRRGRPRVAAACAAGLARRRTSGRRHDPNRLRRYAGFRPCRIPAAILEKVQ